MIDFLKLFKEATVLTSAGSLFQSAGAAAAKERAPSVGSIFCVGGSSRVLLFERRPQVPLFSYYLRTIKIKIGSNIKLYTCQTKFAVTRYMISSMSESMTGHVFAFGSTLPTH